MLWWLGAVACAVVCAYLSAWWWRVVRGGRYWAQRGVPHLQPHPLLGSLTWLQKKNAAVWFREMYDKFRSPYVGIWLFWRPALIINSREIARRVLIKDSDNFRNRLLSSGSHDPIGGLNLFTVNDPEWTFIRRPLTAVFTGVKMRAMHDFVAKKSLELVERFEVEMKSGKKIDLRSVFSDFSTDIIGTSSFGVTNDVTRTGDSPIRVMTKEFMKFDTIRGLAWATIFFLPELVKIFRFTFFPKVTVNYFMRVWKQMVAQRGGYDAHISGTRDLLDCLMKIKQDAKKAGQDLSEEMLVAQAVIFIQGGFDTTAVTLTYTTYELAFQPNIQENLYNELQETKQKLGTTHFNDKTLADLPYLNAVINETLRKYPPMGWLDRVAESDYQIDEELKISAGTPIYVNAVGLHYDPELFPKPDEYDPSRFLPENEHAIQPYSYMPFGEGPRHCIGMRFAYQTVRSALAHVVCAFRFQPLPGTPQPNSFKPDKKGLFFMPSDPMSVQFVLRE